MDFSAGPLLLDVNSALWEKTLQPHRKIPFIFY
jgi:hypothetical protein